MKQKAVVFDIREIFFKKSREVHRVNYLTGETETFLKTVPNKISIREAIYALQELSREYKIVLISTIPESYRLLLESWLCHKQIVYNNLYMKPDDSKQSTDMYKVQLFFDSINHKYDVESIFDSRKDVINFLESE